MSTSTLQHDTGLLGLVGARISDAVSWVASALSMAAALGWVNLAIGVLSALWLATQIWRFWRYEIHVLRAKARAAADICPTPDED